MEEKKTVQYKRTMRGTLGAGASALFNGNGRRFYILEHRDASKYHKAGESQKIIVDQVELGRGIDCQVRFDETFETVSRRHAAIVRDGDRWKLVQLSTTNTTFLNGRAIDTEWYLQNGDEIQLAVGGPRLGFIVPEGRQGLVSSIKLTHRIKLASEQALRPYRRTIAAMAAVLVLAIAGLGTWNVMLQRNLIEQSNTIAEQAKTIGDNEAAIDSLTGKLTLANNEITDLNKKISRQAGNIRSVNIKIDKIVKNDTITEDLTPVIKNVYKIYSIPVYNGKQFGEYVYMGTGFLLDNGYFVTAQHVVQYDQVDLKVIENSETPDDPDDPKKRQTVIDPEGIRTLTNAYYYAVKIKFRIICVSPTDDLPPVEYSYSTNPFKVGKSQVNAGAYKDRDGQSWIVRVHNYGNGDWAYMKVNKSGGIPFDSNLSKNLPMKTKLQILGFPANQGDKTRGSISPICSECITSRAGLEDNGTIKTSNHDSDHGNSGGPVVLWKDKKYVVVGILSGANYGSDATHSKGRVIPIGAAF